MSRFRVLQFNMQFGQVWDEADPDRAPINLEATLAEIKSHGADIIMLQEVERARPGGTHPPTPPNYSFLKQGLDGYHSTFSFPRPDPRELPFGIGLAIFSRWPLQEKACINLPSPPVEFDFFGEKKTPTDRLLISANTIIAGREVRLMNTHLLAFFMLKSSSEEHRQQRDLVEQELRRLEIPTLLPAISMSPSMSRWCSNSRPRATKRPRIRRSPGVAGPMCSTTFSTTHPCAA